MRMKLLNDYQKLIEKDNLTLVYNYSEKHHSYYREIFILDK